MQFIIKSRLLVFMCLLGIVTTMGYAQAQKGFPRSLRDAFHLFAKNQNVLAPDVSVLENAVARINHIALQPEEFSREPDQNEAWPVEYRLTLYRDGEQRIRKAEYSRFSLHSGEVLDVEEYYGPTGNLIAFEYVSFAYQPGSPEKLEIHGTVYMHEGKPFQNRSYQVLRGPDGLTLNYGDFVPDEFHSTVDDLLLTLRPIIVAANVRR